MTFAKRAINVTFGMSKENPAYDGKANLVNLEGFRVECVLSNPGINFITGTVQLRIYGMKESDMNAFSSDLLSPVAVRQDNIAISAGDVGGQIKQIFNGSIKSANIDYNQFPEIAFQVSAVDGFLHQIIPTAPSSFEGEFDVADAIQSIVSPMGYGFENLGVDRKLSNQYLSGTAMDKLKTIANAANIVLQVDDKKVTIWNTDKARDTNAFNLSPETGLIGYPSYTSNLTIKCQTQFNPEFKNGKLVNLTTSVKKMCGTYQIINVVHDISTISPNAPWYSTIDLRPQGYFAAKI